MLCIFDCESVPDVDLLRELYDYQGSDIEICNIAFGDFKNKTSSSFLPLPFHKIISISALICDDFGNFVKIGNIADSIENRQEVDMIDNFLKYINKNNPKLISFNGKGFDIPLILLRAMKYNLDASAYFDISNVNLNKNKWENYRQRYSESFHVDLLDSISSFGMVRGIRLDVACKMLGLPGKFDVSGEDVFELYYLDNDLKKIDEYCQSDVLNTYWLYLKYCILQGKITKNEYALILDVFINKIPKDKAYYFVFKNALELELEHLK